MSFGTAPSKATLTPAARENATMALDNDCGGIEKETACGALTSTGNCWAVATGECQQRTTTDTDPSNTARRNTAPEETFNVVGIAHLRKVGDQFHRPH
jgi:hypothetical protein